MNLPNFHQQPHFLRATFHINTPMFVAGANQKEAELTPTAFKGVMRFWWRALNWSKISLKHNDKSSALKELHRQEAELFGLASGENKGGQGKCLVNTVKFDAENIKKWHYVGNRNGVNYLLGQGLFHFKNLLTREAILDKQVFTVDLTINQPSTTIIQDTLQIIGLLGGFGSRSRHGFGSVTLTKLEKKSLTDSGYQAIDFEKNATIALENLLTSYDCKKNPELPPLSAFYQGTRIDVINFNNKTNALDLLNKIGEEQQMYRSYGRNGLVNGEKAEQRFDKDHDFAINMIKNKPNTIAHPQRVVFGLPHNYFYSGNSTTGHSANVDASTGRRASPLFIHIHQTNNQYQAIHCLLRSEFLPNGATVDIKARRSQDKKSVKVNANVDYQIIENFMNRPLFNNKESI